MRNFLARMPITRKLFSVNFVVILVASFVTAAVLILVERTAMRERVVNELVAQADIVAFNSAASLAFDEAASAQDILEAFQAVPQVQEAIIFNLQNDVFARYLRNEQGAYHSGYTEIAGGRVQWPNKPGHDVVFSDEGIFIYTPVTLDGERVGALYIRSSLDNFNAYSQQAIVLGVIALVIAMLVALLLLAPMVKIVSDPILELLFTVNAVRRDKDYHVRVAKLANDEFGELADAFNAMLEEIGQRDAELSRQQMSLESEVQERTQAMKKANRHLEETVHALQQANRAIRISEENKRVAEASAEAKAQFLANMSHELRTPMNGVLGMLSLLLETRLNDDQRHYVDVAYESGNILLELLNNVLDLSKIEQGKLALECIPFNLRESIDEVVAIVGESAYAKELELVVLREPDVPVHVMGDPTRFKQLIFNLVGNAIKFTHKGFVSVNCIPLKIDSDSVSLRFEIQDTGVGIEPEVRDRIFDSFTQADSSTTRKYGGTGLGLSLCKQIVQLMNGRIGVNSKVDDGSLFWFEVEFKSVEMQALESSGTAQDTQPTPPVSMLVLDPSPVSANAMSHYLEEIGVHGDIVTNEFELLSRLETCSIPYARLLISLDLGMSLIRRLLSIDEVNARFKPADVLFYGSIGQRNIFRQDKDNSAHEMLIKPIRLSHLKKLLMGCLPTGESQQAVAGGSARSRMVLVVEDNLINQEVAVGLLGKLGYQVDVADNGEIALQKMRARQYDAVLMDCQMPVLDGYSATRTIRQWERDGRPRTCIIAMTAHAMAGDRELCASAGMDDYLAKPVKADALRQILARWLTCDAEASREDGE